MAKPAASNVPPAQFFNEKWAHLEGGLNKLLTALERQNSISPKEWCADGVTDGGVVPYSLRLSAVSADGRPAFRVLQHVSHSRRCSTRLSVSLLVLCRDDKRE